MRMPLASKIEERRGDPSPFWRSLVATKDSVWRYLLLGDVEFKLIYYRGNFRRRILQTMPMQCDKDDPLEVHILTCKRDLLDALWSLKSFYHYNDLSPRLVVHEDGTFDEACIRAFKGHFKGCKIIRLHQANKEVKEWLKGKRYAKEYRFKHYMFHSIKLFDFFKYSDTDRIFFMDSDLLFFKRSKEITDNLKAKRGFFMSDYKSSYSFKPKKLGELLGMEIVPNVNSGLVHFPLDQYDPQLLERYLKICSDRNFPRRGWMEQTAYAVLFSRQPGVFKRLSPRHQISLTPHDADTISHHYVWDGSRKNYYLVGLKQLKRAGLLKALS